MANVHMLACLLATGIAMAFASEAASAQDVDAVGYFQKARQARGEGIAKKTKLVDVRPAKAGEVVVTIIKGEGKETQSAPAKAGDKIVRNRCAATGNEEILVKAATFARRYEGPGAAADASGWRAYRPRGNPMKFVVVAEGDGTFTFRAPWGEQMIARPGDMIVQDPNRTTDTYRIAKAAFDCTYEILRQPQPKSNTRPRQQ